MVVDEVKDYINNTIDYIETSVRVQYKKYQEEDKNDMLSKVNGQELGSLLLNKSIFETVLSCLNPEEKGYNCFAAIEPILDRLHPNKKDWLPVFGLLLSKAKKEETDYSILTNYLEKTKDKNLSSNLSSINEKVRGIFIDSDNKESLQNTIFLDRIVNENGEFLPYILTNYDRFLLQALGLSFDQVALISKQCRSLYKKEQAEKQQKELEQKPVKKTVPVDLNKINKDIKVQKEKLEYIKRFLSLEDYSIIYTKYITEEEEESIISVLQELNFSLDRIELLKNRIRKYNKQVEENILITKINVLKQELFTPEMFSKYETACQTIADGAFVYRNLKEDLQNQLNYIDNIVLNCVNGVETKEDTCEYLIMAFEDLSYSLKLCGPIKKSTL